MILPVLAYIEQLLLKRILVIVPIHTLVILARMEYYCPMLIKLIVVNCLFVLCASQSFDFFYFVQQASLPLIVSSSSKIILLLLLECIWVIIIGVSEDLNFLT
ncbi:hypothetical protein P3S68_019961 [Capsicum galapagoense]